MKDPLTAVHPDHALINIKLRPKANRKLTGYNATKSGLKKERGPLTAEGFHLIIQFHRAGVKPENEFLNRCLFFQWNLRREPLLMSNKSLQVGGGARMLACGRSHLKARPAWVQGFLLLGTHSPLIKINLSIYLINELRGFSNIGNTIHLYMLLLSCICSISPKLKIKQKTNKATWSPALFRLWIYFLPIKQISFNKKVKKIVAL